MSEQETDELRIRVELPLEDWWWLLAILGNRAKSYEATARFLRMDAESVAKHVKELGRPIEDCDSPEEADSEAEGFREIIGEISAQIPDRKGGGLFLKNDEPAN